MLSAIAESHHVALSVLEALNPQIENYNLIFPGQMINLPLPAGGTHVVAAGDTLYNLAISYNVELTCLENGNSQIQNPNLIYPGDVVNISASCLSFNPFILLITMMT